MKSFHIKFAIVSCTLALTACGAGETETDKASIDEVGGSAYQQALGADGDVDCERIHDVLWDHGIDPAQLEPDFVFEACVNSGTGEDVCQIVAYSCFGDQGCTEPHPPQPPNEPQCQEMWELAEQSGIDPSQVGPDEAFEYCVNANYPDDVCVQVYECFPAPQPQPEPICEDVIQLADDLQIDVEGMSHEEVLQVCLDHGYSEDLCWTVIEQCIDPTDPDDPNDPDETDPNDPTQPDQLSCEDVERFLADGGQELPSTDEEAQALYDECLQSFNDEALCQAALDCVYP